MNCWEFDQVVMDVARSETRGVLMDAAVKQQALAHAQDCSRCAICLASEKSLSQGFRAVAAEDCSLAAPPVVENALLAAFRQQQAERPRPIPVAPVVTESAFQLFFVRMRWALVAAAALALVVFAVARMLQPAPAQQIAGDKSVIPTPTATAKPFEPENVNTPVLPAPEMVKAEVRNNVRPRQVKVSNGGRATSREGRVTVDVGEFVIDEPEALSAKDFLVFDYARNLPPADSTQLMRVRMPREKLAPLGIQVPRAVRNNDYVNADFLVGSDGVPRAIRVMDR